MRQPLEPPAAALGLTVKSGWAASVLVLDAVDAPRIADARRVDLSDPAKPESRQPYHASFGTARTNGPELTRLIASVERFGHDALTRLIREYRAAGRPLSGIGVIVGSLADPERIANDHIRIHALEGRLFRGIVEHAAEQNGVPCSIWRERDIHGLAVLHLHQPEPAIRRTLAALGRGVAGSWRAEQKTAALAAWLVLAQGTSITRV